MKKTSNVKIGNIVAKKMFDVCGIAYRKYNEKNKEVKIKL